jgi:hypothetical protein
MSSIQISRRGETFWVFISYPNLMKLHYLEQQFYQWCLYRIISTNNYMKPYIIEHGNATTLLVTICLLNTRQTTHRSFNQLSVYIPCSYLSHRGELKFPRHLNLLLLYSIKTNYQSPYMCIFINIDVTLKFIYIFLVKFHTFGFILKKYTAVITGMHFISQYVITKVCLTHAHTLYAVLTGIWHLEMKHNHSKWVAKLLPV